MLYLQLSDSITHNGLCNPVINLVIKVDISIMAGNGGKKSKIDINFFFSFEGGLRIGSGYLFHCMKSGSEVRKNRRAADRSGEKVGAGGK